MPERNYFLVACIQCDNDDVGFGGFGGDMWGRIHVIPGMDRDSFRDTVFRLVRADEATMFHVILDSNRNHIVFRQIECDDCPFVLIDPASNHCEDSDALKDVVDDLADINKKLAIKREEEIAAMRERVRLEEENQRLQEKLSRIALYKELRKEFEGY